MNNSFYPSTNGAVKSALVPAYPTAPVAGQKFTVAPHVRMDNAFIDAWMPRCGAQAWAVLTMLLRWKGGASESHPRKQTLADATGLSLYLVEKALRHLTRIKLIEPRAHFGADGAQTANRYYFLTPAYSFTPPPASKNSPPSSPKFAPSKQKKQKNKKTEKQSSARAAVAANAVVVENSQSSFVSEAVETLLAELDALGGLNATTARLCETQPDEAARQIENLRRAQLKGTIQNPAAWFNRAVAARYELREVKATPDATPKPRGRFEADAGNTGAYEEWKPDRSQHTLARDNTSLEAKQRMTALVAATLAQMTPQKRLSYEAGIAGMELLAKCQYLDGSAPIEFAAARESLKRSQKR